MQTPRPGLSSTDLIAGRYRLGAPLGAGGMGTVFEAHDQLLQRRVAIKCLPPELKADPSARERLRREALAAAALDHPFICKIFEMGEDHDTVFIVMECVGGETLHTRLARGAIPSAEALRIAGEIADALEAAHARHVVHRDLKPGNVMLTAQGRVKVMDFGLAKQLPVVGSAPRRAETGADTALPPLTDRGLRVGTPDYMSPEQVRGETVDERSDLFAFGILLCELLTGQHPFRRSSSAETMTAILREPPSISATRAVDLAGPVSVVLRRLLAKAPADRLGTIAEVRQVLTRLTATPAGLTPRPAAPEAGARVPCMMVGRDAEHAELLRRVDAAIAGRGSIVLVGGEPGIGKTRLTQALLADARARGCFCVVGHCYEGEGAPPYVPFIETLEYSARVLPPETFRRTLGDAAPEVAKLMPELRQLFPDIPPAIQLPPEQQRRFLFNAYREFVDRACTLTPLVLVLEDLHWADEPTLLLMQHLVQTVATTPLLIVGTYRDVELDVNRPFARTLETLLRERLATRIALDRLPASGVESMLQALSGQPAPSSLSRVVFQETEGNPFFVEEVFQHLAEDGQLFDATGTWRTDLRVDTLQVPEGVRLVIGRRLQRLSEGARRVLTTAAVVGRSFSVALLEALESAQPDAVLEALEEAERAQLVVAESSGRVPRYRFTHELIRQTLAEGLSLPRRQRVHARVAEAIERVYAPSVEKHASALAHHLYQAGAAAEVEKTSRYLQLAADQARAAAAHEESLTLLDHALSLFEGGTDGRIADLHAGRAGALRSLGRTGEAVKAYERAIGLFEARGDVEKLASTAVELSLLLGWNWRPEAALRVVDRALDRLGEAAPTLRCSLLLVRANSMSLGGDPDGGVAALVPAQELQRTLGDPNLERLASRVEAAMRFQVMQMDQASELGRDAVSRCRAANDPWGEVGCAPYEPMGALWGGRQAEGMRRFEEIRGLAERIGHQQVLAMCQYAPVLDAMYRGDLEVAERAARDLLAFELKTETGGFLNQLFLGLIMACQGERVDAVALLQDAVESEPEHAWSGASATTLAWVLAHDDGDAAADILRVGRPRLPQRGRIATSGAWVSLVNVVETLALMDRQEEVAALHASTEDLAATGVHCWSVTMFATAAGVAAACAREWTRAETHHQRAIQQADAAYRICQPDARVWYADMLLARRDASDRTRARALLAEALALYESIGMPGFAQRTSARLAAV